MKLMVFISWKTLKNVKQTLFVGEIKFSESLSHQYIDTLKFNNTFNVCR